MQTHAVDPAVPFEAVMGGMGAPLEPVCCPTLQRNLLHGRYRDPQGISAQPMSLCLRLLVAFRPLCMMLVMWSQRLRRDVVSLQVGVAFWHFGILGMKRIFHVRLLGLRGAQRLDEVTLKIV